MWEAIGSILSILIILLGVFLKKQSESDKEREATKEEEAEKQKAREDRLPERAKELIRVNDSIDLQTKAREEAFKKIHAELGLSKEEGSNQK